MNVTDERAAQSGTCGGDYIHDGDLNALEAVHLSLCGTAVASQGR